MKILNTKEKHIFSLIQEAFDKNMKKLIGEPLTQEDIEEMRSTIESWGVFPRRITFEISHDENN